MIELRQDVNVNVGLMLTPSIDLSLRILAMNVLELEEKVKDLAEENPLIKISEDIDIQKQPYRNKDKLKELSESFKERFSNDDSVDILETTVSENDTLPQSLARQVNYEYDLDELEEEIALFVIYNLDEKGFLDASLKDIAEKFNVSKESADDIRHKIMSLEPLGCGSINTAEFLKFQVKEYGIENKELLFKLIDILHGSTKPNLKRIQDKLNVDDKLFSELLKELSNFMLFPLENYTVVDNRIYIEPDVYIKKIDGRLVTILNEKNLNRINIDEKLLKEYMNNKQAKQFLEERYKQAKQFMLSIAQRNKTLLRTVNIIIEKQARFFKDGVLMPLTRKDIADELHFNVSTITRAVSNKYADYEGKIIPLKNFFSFGVGDNISKDFIKNVIRKIVDEEDKNDPLNDSDIKSLLEKQNINITRRTVTKYRKELNIDNSRLRKCRTI